MKKYAALALVPFFLSALSYDVQIAGMNDPNCLKALQRVSDLYTLQDRPPASINGLRYRVESDLPNLIKVLRAYAYYDASITYEIDLEKGDAFVTLFVHSGEQYRLSTYQVFKGDCNESADLTACCPFNPYQLGLALEKPALSFDIVNAELQLLTELSRCGYPLATIEKRRVEVDMEKKEVNAAVCIQEGPMTKFGPSSLYGLRNIHPRFIERKLAWKEGDVYNSDLVEETKTRFLGTDLFSSVLINHGDTVDQLGELPMKLNFTEAKHKSISIGFFYATVDGPGATFSWTNRNFRGMGEIVNLEGDLSSYNLSGKLSYKKPDFLRTDQVYRAHIGVMREAINPYTAFSYRFANYIDRKMSPTGSFSIGLKAENINVSDSATNGTYALIGLPLFVKYDWSNSDLDPTHGYTVVYQLTPYQTLNSGNRHFAKQRLTGTVYIPFTQSQKFVLSLRLQFGSIAGTAQDNVPLPKLFLGGSEDDLRGYRYKTVSPLDERNKPLGGRSAIFATAETRFRATKTLGIVPFADFGTVTLSELPTFNAKWYKSVGVGVRYYAFFGPLRFDVGFPLNRRKIDPKFRIYATVGQTF